MKTYFGKSVFPGIALGPAFLLRPVEKPEHPQLQNQPEQHAQAFAQALQTADRQLEELIEQTANILGPQQAQILEAQRMILADLDFQDLVHQLITQSKFTAADSVHKAGKHFSSYFSTLDDAYMKARGADILDVSDRLYAILTGQPHAPRLFRPCILVAEDLAPSQTMALNQDYILAIVTQGGTQHSHTAILARTLGIPCIIQATLPLQDIHGLPLAINADIGAIYVRPDTNCLAQLAEKQAAEQARLQEEQGLRDLPTITTKGQHILLTANIGRPEDVDSVLENGGEGIGLFRSEFLFLGKNAPPSEEEQYEAYALVAQKMGRRPVTIRTFDLGADKQVPYLDLPPEENPALGMRGVRLALQRPQWLKDQLRALYRAAALGNLSVMFPMITSLREVHACREIANQTRQELTAQNIPIGPLSFGIMIETPAAVMIAQDLAREVDFFSVGTNDLVQYTLAADRQNPAMEAYAEADHPAVLFMMQVIADAAKKAGIHASICGELASNPVFTHIWLEMGYQELSMPPAFILERRHFICNL